MRIVESNKKNTFFFSSVSLFKVIPLLEKGVRVGCSTGARNVIGVALSDALWPHLQMAVGNETSECVRRGAT